MKKRVGILGGTFDPPHIGHLIIANEVLHRLNLHQVEFMPNQEPPHKNRTSGTTLNNRLEMLELAIEEQPAFSIEKIELERQGRSFTIDTINILQQLYPEKEYYFIIGADMVEYLPKWHKIEELVKKLHFIGVSRPNYQLKSPYPVTSVEVPQIDISSSLIRDRRKMGESIKYLLPDKVISYIEENYLYES